MADQKLSALTSLAAADVVLADDILEIVDTSVTTNKKITAEALRVALRPVLGTVATTTSGTEHDFTGIPAGTRRITISLVGVSVSGTSNLLVQLGDSGGLETTGYLGAGSNSSTLTAANYTTGFGINLANAANLHHGSLVLTLVNSGTFTWACSGSGGLSNSAITFTTGGSKSLSAELTQVRLTTVNGSDTFDAGSANILYE